MKASPIIAVKRFSRNLLDFEKPLNNVKFILDFVGLNIGC
jgi:hypothetical protein